MGGGGGGGGGYPLKAQARSPQDQRLATQSRVSRREEGNILNTVENHECFFQKSKKVNLFP